MKREGSVIKFNTWPRIPGRKRCKNEGMDGNLFKNIIVKFFALFIEFMGYLESER